jgi:hypothetical protein
MIQLAHSVLKIFLEETNISSLNTAVALHRHALIIQTSRSLDRSASFAGLASALYSRFYQTGQTEDLDEAISSYRDSVTNTSHPDRLGWLHGLCTALLTRFGETGQFKDLRDAVAFFYRPGLQRAENVEKVGYSVSDAKSCVCIVDR